MRGGTPARRRESAEEPENCGAGARGLSAATEHLFKTLDLLCNFTRSIYIVVVDVAVVRNEKKKKGKGCTSSEDALYCFLLPQVKSFICYNLSYFLTIFNCIYVSFLYINYLQI